MKNSLVRLYMQNRYSPTTRVVNDGGTEKTLTGRITPANADERNVIHIFPLTEADRRSSQYVRRIKRRHDAAVERASRRT